MKVLKWILIVLVVVIGIYAIAMLFMDGQYSMQRSAVVDAPQERVYSYASDLKSWENWEPWQQTDTTTELTYSENTSGEGAHYSWKGEKIGAGTLTITRAVEPVQFDYRIEFQGMGASDGSMTFKDTLDGKTKVTWSFEGEMPFLMRWMAGSIDKEVGPQFKKGLASLKDQLETKSSTSQDYKITETKVEPLDYYYIRSENTAWSDMEKEISTSFDNIYKYLQPKEEDFRGSAFIIYHKWDEENRQATMDIALPVMSDKPENDSVKKDTRYSGMALKTTHKGNYDDFEAAYMALEEYLKANKMEMAGSPWEEYIVGMGQTKNPEEFVTDIYYPVMEKGEMKGGDMQAEK